jgi:hypothetical protein
VHTFYVRLYNTYTVHVITDHPVRWRYSGSEWFNRNALLVGSHDEVVLRVAVTGLRKNRCLKRERRTVQPRQTLEPLFWKVIIANWMTGLVSWTGA